MKAVIHKRFALPREAFEYREVDRPEAAEGRILVRVHAAGIAIGDWLIAQGLPYIARPSYGLRSPKAPIAGLEVAGVVESIGAGVQLVEPGAQVFGWCQGAFAEYAAVQQETVARKPNNATFEESAALPISGCAALQAVRDAGGLERGQSVLVLGASGAVGTFAVQIAKALGGHVTGVCSARNVELVRSIGAEDVIDYTGEELGRSGRRFDLVLNLAGNRPVAELRRLTEPKGTIVMVGGSGGRWTMGFGRTVRASLLSPFIGQRIRPFFSKPTLADLGVLRDLVESGGVKPVIDKTFGLSETANALEYIGERHTQGKSVITI